MTTVTSKKHHFCLVGYYKINITLELGTTMGIRFDNNCDGLIYVYVLLQGVFVK